MYSRKHIENQKMDYVGMLKIDDFSSIPFRIEYNTINCCGPYVFFGDCLNPI